MKRILYYSLVLLAAGNGMLQAQNWIHGKVVDKEERPVDGVAVVLQTLDSTYIDAVVTDCLLYTSLCPYGRTSFRRTELREYCRMAAKPE